MYLEFYELHKAPFHITPDPEFLFLSPSHKAALGAIIYGIEERQGFVAITGEVGLGKTTLLRSYLERVDPRTLKTIYIFNANIAFPELLRLVAREFGLEAEGEDPFALLQRLQQALVEEYQRGRNVALIIDEAQNMPVETLENLRLLSNLETATEKLLQIVLVGQPELEHKLARSELRQLKQRIVIHATLQPLTPEESLAYIRHRLAKVTTSPTPIFSKRALKCIVEHARGTPRLLNILCTNALIAGFGYRQRPIRARTVRQVIAELEGRRLPRRAWAVAATAAGVLLAAGLFWASPYRPLLLSRFSSSPAATLRDLYSALPQVTQKMRHKLLPQAPSAPDNGATSPLPTGNGHRQTVAPAPAAYLAPLPAPPAAESTPPPGDPEASPAAIATLPAPPASPAEPPAPPAPPGEPSVPPIALPAPAAAPPPAAESPSPSPPPAAPGRRFPVLHTAQKGDYVSKLAKVIYGYTDDALIAWIAKHNPHLKDINHIEVGDVILFPAPESPRE
ncbi:MAG: hypothetical protein KatS3mg131_2210 [Candidatus Tectimicrobiota bacterium]|nr:MAG: hypothetical protein KatS3mg131_2210 [Candidatus Tectomicrobia bacterium]